VDHPLPWLKYVDAGDVDDETTAFDGMQVTGTGNDKLGTVKGFIVDSDTARPYYVVVDAGGWFKSKHFLLPVGHARIQGSDDDEALVADVPRERIDRFPGFDLDEFDKLKADDLKRLNDEICQVCGSSASEYSADEPYSAAWERDDYRQPDWWQAEPSLPSRMGDGAFKEQVDYPPLSGSVNYPPAAASMGYAPVAGSKDYAPVSGSAAVDDDAEERERREERERQSERELVTAREGKGRPDPSPYFDGRAQPGDVIGLETGGEQTHVGETKDDEDRRREQAERAASEQDD
jgi:hypothetical protein